MGIKDMFSVLFSTGADIEDNSDVKFTKEQQETLDKIKKAEPEVEIPISDQAKSGKGLRKKYKTPDITIADEKSKKDLERMTKILQGQDKAEKERGE